MSIEQVRRHLAQYGIDHRIQEFDVSSATVALAAEALQCAPCRIAKSLAFQRKRAGDTVLVVTAGDAKVDNAKYKAAFGEKATMLPPEETMERTGHAVGGVCPFAVKAGVPIFLDASLRRFETVYPACGSSNSAIELSLPELERYTDFQGWVDVCKGWESA